MSIEKIDFQWADLEDPDDSPIQSQTFGCSCCANRRPITTKEDLVLAIREIINYHERKSCDYYRFLRRVLETDFEELKRLAAEDKLEI